MLNIVQFDKLRDGFGCHLGIDDPMIAQTTATSPTPKVQRATTQYTNEDGHGYGYLYFEPTS